MTINLKKLSEREQEILRLVATGASNKEIAHQLSISTNTVKVHLRNIFDKIQVNSRTEAAMAAVSSGLVSGFPQSGDIETRKGTETADLSVAVHAQQEISQTSKTGLSFRRIVLAGLVAIVLLVIGSFIYWRWRTGSQNNPPAQIGVAWKSLASMPTARYSFATVVYDNKIFALGGKDDQGVTSAVEEYDPQFNRWLGKKSKQVAVGDVQAAGIGGKIYVPGGSLASGEATDILEIYDINENIWRLSKSLPITVSAYAIAEYEGKIYVFGGRNRDGYLSTVLVYDPDLDAWSVKTPMLSPRAYAGAVTVGNIIYLLGGFDGKKALDLVETYEPNLDDGINNPWSRLERMPERRYGMGIASVLEVIYLVGGMGEEETPVPMQGYLTRTGEWQMILAPGKNAWTDLALVALGNDIYAMGGMLDGAPSSDLFAMQVVFISVLPFVP